MALIHRGPKKQRGPYRFSTFNQPQHRRWAGVYWASIPLEAFNAETRMALADIPHGQWWFEDLAPEPEMFLTTAKVIILRDDGYWQVRSSCRHLVHKARAWARRQDELRMFQPHALAAFAPENESALVALTEAQRNYLRAFGKIYAEHTKIDVVNPFPGIPGNRPAPMIVE
jgi:hypothetical protein